MQYLELKKLIETTLQSHDAKGNYHFQQSLRKCTDINALEKLAGEFFGEPGITIPIWQQILKFRPNFDHGWIQLGWGYYLHGDDKLARECLGKIKMDQVDGLLLLGALEKSLTKQLKIYERVLVLDPENRVAKASLQRLR